MKYILLTLIFIISTSLYSQHNNDSVENIIEMIKIYLQEDNDINETINEDLEDRLISIYNNKINLNTATREQLENLIFLSDIQIENLLFYIYTMGKMETIYELQHVEGLPKHIIRFLLPFVNIEPIEDTTNWTKEFKQIKNRISISSGYKHPSPQSTLEGTIPLKAQLRYKIQAGKALSAGIIADHDAQEQFYGNTAKGFDHYKIYADLRPIGSILKSVSIGSFKASFGQGLLLGDMSYGSPIDVISKSSAHAQSGIRSYGGSDEYNYFNGCGANMQFGAWKISAFYSYRLHDTDTTDGYFSSIDKTGLHNTSTSIEKQNSLLMHTMCAHTSYIGKRFELGLTTLFNYHNISKTNPPNPYYLYKFSGKTQFGTSFNYRWFNRYFSLYGEWGINQDFGLACINTLNISPSSETSIIINHRYYSPKYDMYYSNPYSTTSDGTNEHGATIGFIQQLPQQWQLNSYLDIYKNIWINYTTSRPTLNGSIRVDAKYNNWEKITGHFYVKYKYYQSINSSDVDINKIPHLQNKEQISIKGTFRYKLNNIIFTSGVMGAYNLQDKNSSIALVQEISCSLFKNYINIATMISIFKAEDWDNRLYWYERNMPYSSYSPSLYGNGMRWYFMCKGTPTDYLDIYLRIAQSIKDENGIVKPTTDFSLMLLLSI